MASVKISALPVANPLVDADLLAVSQDIATTPVTRKATALDIKTYVGTSNPFDQSLNTTDLVLFDSVNSTTGGFVDESVSGGGLTPANIDNAGKIIRGSALGSQRQVIFGVDENSNMGNYRVRTLTASGNFNFAFSIPADFVSLVTISAVFITTAGAAGAGKDIDLASDYGIIGQNFAFNSEIDTSTVFNLGASNDINEISLATVFTSLAASQFCGVNISHNGIGGSLDYLFINLVYNV